MKIKDLQSGRIFDYGGCHDSLSISNDGRTLTYYNLQNGDGSRFGDYRFVMEDGKVPAESLSADAIHGECYFNIGGFPSVDEIRSETIDEFTCKLIELDKEFPIIEDEYGEKRPMYLSEMCKLVKEQLKEQD